ncbi:MAG: sigma-70 family RNA polymerase sigma factor, partial [Sphingobacteriales bacterium]
MSPFNAVVPVKIDEKELVTLLKCQDRKAFSYLYDNYSGALLGVIVKVVGDGERARDLLQEVFVKIWKSVISYDDTKGTLYTWMFRVARNAAIDCLRSCEFKNDVRTSSFEAQHR